MKKTKIISGLMAMAMTVMSLGISASAADSVAVKIGTAEAKAGADFSVDVSLSSVPSSGLSSIDFAINYDSGLKISDVSLGTIGDTGAKAAEGDLGDTVFNWYDNGKQIVIVWSTGLTDSKYWVAKDGVFVTLKGKVDSGAKAGTTLKLEGAGANRNVYPDSSTKASTYLSAVGTSGTTNYEAAFTAGGVTVPDETTQSTEESKSTSGKENNDADWGNVNCKGGVDVSDAVLLARFVAEDAGADVSAQGKINADVTHDGEITGDDTVQILKYIAKIVTDLSK
ncbi:MAG: Cohesin domain protein [Oscillospiraceae bacterium]|nr:Cohesin domain protein [Oscillospiraceae bacterium]